MTEGNPLQIHLLADSTGESGVRMARAAVAQFGGVSFELVRHRRVRTLGALVEAIEKVREQAVPGRTAVFFTLVDHELAHLAASMCSEFEMPFADLMSDAMAALHRISGEEPDEQPLRPVGVESDYFARISAINFAVANDDGIAPGAVGGADIVIVGPSRSGKTPLSIYLGYLGYKAVNIPIVPGIEPPAELTTVDKWRLVGLTMAAERLALIRSERVKGLGWKAMGDGYDDLGRIYDELDWVATVHRKLGCSVLDTTGLALEESAARVVETVSARARRLGGSLRRPENVTSHLQGFEPRSSR